MLGTWGYVLIALGTFVEGETILVLAGLAAHRGYLSLPGVIAAAFAGTFTGDQLYFYIGRRHGAAFLARRPAWKARVERAQHFLAEHHVAFILGFRFLYGLRSVSPFAIGMSGVSQRRYLILNTVSALAWSVAVALLGYSVGEGSEALLGRARKVEIALFATIALTGALVWLIYFLRSRRR